jgi:hypothetical protein
MSMPKKIKRFPGNIPDQPKVSGAVHHGIGSDKIAQDFGRMLAEWALLEDQMIHVLHILMGITDLDPPARQIFRSSTSTQQRAKLMRTLLETSRRNKDRGASFDDVISEFEKISTARNEYVHGRWWTQRESGKVYLQPEMKDDFSFLNIREVTDNELPNLKVRIAALAKKVTDLFRGEMQTWVASISQPNGP